MSAAPPLPRWPAAWPGAWVAPVLVAGGWSLALAGAGSLEAQRGMVFVGGPFVLLAGLHARLAGYLHADERRRLLPLPVSAARHFGAASPGHRRGLALGLACGLAGIFAALPHDLARAAWLAADFGWLGLAAILIEPAIAGAAAFAGRRFPEGHWLAEAQRTAAGGWTSHEAAVHLYAPALGIGAAIAAAMPGQLTLDRLSEGAAISPRLWALSAAPMVAALLLRLAARRLYAAGIWEAIPWLEEATRRLAGDAPPRPRPAAIGRVGNPTLQLALTQLLRLCPLLGLRLLALTGMSLWLLTAAAPPSAPALALWAGLAALWLSPLQLLARERRRNAALLRALPLPAPERAGRLRGAEGMIWGVPTLLGASLLARWL